MIIETWQTDGDKKWVRVTQLSAWCRDDALTWVKVMLGVSLDPGKKDRAWGVAVNEAMQMGIREIPERYAAWAWSNKYGHEDMRGVYAIGDLGKIAWAASIAMYTDERQWTEFVAWSPDWYDERTAHAKSLGYDYTMV